jgi:hypothetical protein
VGFEPLAGDATGARLPISRTHEHSRKVILLYFWLLPFTFWLLPFTFWLLPFTFWLLPFDFQERCQLTEVPFPEFGKSGKRSLRLR